MTTVILRPSADNTIAFFKNQLGNATPAWSQLDSGPPGTTTEYMEAVSSGGTTQSITVTLAIASGTLAQLNALLAQKAPCTVTIGETVYTGTVGNGLKCDFYLGSSAGALCSAQLCCNIDSVGQHTSSRLQYFVTPPTLSGSDTITLIFQNNGAGSLIPAGTRFNFIDVTLTDTPAKPFPVTLRPIADSSYGYGFNGNTRFQNETGGTTLWSSIDDPYPGDHTRYIQSQGDSGTGTGIHWPQLNQEIAVDMTNGAGSWVGTSLADLNAMIAAGANVRCRFNVLTPAPSPCGPDITAIYLHRATQGVGFSTSVSYIQSFDSDFSVAGQHTWFYGPIQDQFGAPIVLAPGDNLIFFMRFDVIGNYLPAGVQIDFFEFYLDTNITAAETGHGVDAARGPHVIGETGSGTDSASAGPKASETGTGTESINFGPSIATTAIGTDIAKVGQLRADAGSGSDSATTRASIFAAETGHGVDAAEQTDGTNYQKPGNESGTGTESISIDAQIPAAERGFGIDSAVVDIQEDRECNEFGTGIERACVSVVLEVDDTGTGDDSGGQGGPSANEHGQSVDVGVVTADIVLAETGGGIDADPIPGQLADDTGAGTEAGLSIGFVPGSDSGSGADGVTMAAIMPGTDSGQGSTSAVLAVDTSWSETAISVDTGRLAAIVSYTDTGAGSDAGTSRAFLTPIDLAAGTESGLVIAFIGAIDLAAGSLLGQVDQSHIATEAGHGVDFPDLLNATGNVRSVSEFGIGTEQAHACQIGENFEMDVEDSGEDFAEGIDVAYVRVIHQANDSGTGSVTALASLYGIAGDTATASASSLVIVSNPAVERGFGANAASLAVSGSFSEPAEGVDIGIVAAFWPVSVTGQGSDLATIGLMATEFATAVESASVDQIIPPPPIAIVVDLFRNPVASIPSAHGIVDLYREPVALSGQK